MPEAAILDEILKELKRLKRSGNAPVHMVARASLVSRAAGDLVQASIDYKYDKTKQPLALRKKQVRAEAVATAAECIRFLEILK